MLRHNRGKLADRHGCPAPTQQCSLAPTPLTLALHHHNGRPCIQARPGAADGPGGVQRALGRQLLCGAVAARPKLDAHLECKLEEGNSGCRAQQAVWDKQTGVMSDMRRTGGVLLMP